MSTVLHKGVRLPASSAAVSRTYPEYETEFKLDNVCSFSAAELEQLNIPDRKAARSMSLSSMLMTDVGMAAHGVLASTLQKKPFAVALYAVIDNGPDDYSSCFEVENLPEAEFPKAYKKSRSPKQYLKQLPNVAPAQLGIFLGAMGALNVYVHTKHGVLQALEQAEADLAAGVTEVAVVVSAFSLEDALLAHRYQLLGPGRDVVLSEGAACIALGQGGNGHDWRAKIKSLKSYRTYGIGTHLINLIEEGAI